MYVCLRMMSIVAREEVGIHRSPTLDKRISGIKE